MSDNKIEFTNDTWEYRVVRKESENGSDEWYSVQEVYFDDDKKPYAYTLDLQVENDTITGMRTQLEKMLEALDNPVLDESDITEDNLNTVKDQVLELEMENAELRDRLTELGEQIKSIPNDMELGEKVRGL